MHVILSNLCVYVDLHSETRRIPNEQTNLSTKELEKKKRSKTQSQQKEGDTKCRVNKLKKSIREDKENHFESINKIENF